MTHKEQVTYEEWVEAAAKVMGKKAQMIKIKTPKDMTLECISLLENVPIY